MSTVHLLKPALGISDVSEFQGRMSLRLNPYEGRMLYTVWTTRKPKQMDELMNGGSVYWIVKKAIQCRQDILGWEEFEGENGKPYYNIYCEPQLIRTVAVERRPFQGWRYLQLDQAPADIGAVTIGDEPPPEEMVGDLRAAGLL